MPWRTLDLSKEEIDEAARRWKKRARFLVDEGVDAETIPFLRGKGYNVKGVGDLGLSGRSDEDVYAMARKEDRIVLTHDGGFLDDRRFPPHPRVGVAMLPGGSGDTLGLVRALVDMLIVIGDYRDAFRGAKFVFNSDRTLTIRNRDHSTGAVVGTRYRLRRNATPEVWEEQ